MGELKLEKQRYSRKEVAQIVGVTPNTIYRREKEGRVNVKPIHIVHSGDKVYTPDMVRAHIEFQHAEKVA